MSPRAKKRADIPPVKPSGEIVDLEIVLPEEAVNALMRFTKAKSPEEAVGKAVLLIKGKKSKKAKP